MYSRKILAIFLVLLLYIIPAYTDRGETKVDILPVQTTVEKTGVDGENREIFIEDIVNPSSKVSVSHVSSVTWLGNGKIACVWYGGSREGARDVNIYYSVYNERTRKWSEEKVLASRTSASGELGRYVKKVGNAVIFNDPENRLWLFYVSITFGGWSGSSLNYKLSLDQGETWSPSQKLILSPFLNLSNLVKNKPVLLEGGGFLLPIYHELIYKFPEILWAALDGDKLRYVKKRMNTQSGIIQPALFAANKQKLIAYFRNASGGGKKFVLKSVSLDSGATWTEPLSTTLPNPNSGLDIAAAPGGRVVMVLNDTFKNRRRLAVYASTDYGNNWKKIKYLENTDGKEFSYPSIIRTPDYMYHITYTYNREYIKHVAFSEAWVRKNES